jgi:ribonuclease-3
MKKLQENMGYFFKNPELLKTSLSHSSYANEIKKGAKSNERLEFLGDAVLSIIVSDYLFKNYTHLPEGELTKLRASLVCEKNLAEYAKDIKLGEFVLLGKGEELNGGRERSSILADAFEAVLAALYLDSDLETATEYILKFVKNQLNTTKEVNFKDYKTILQEIIQQNREEKVRYILTDEFGPDHDKKFVVEVHLNSNVIGKGQGRSKKEAEQQAAREALELMGR